MSRKPKSSEPIRDNRVGVRELRNHAGRVLERVQAGEHLVVTLPKMRRHETVERGGLLSHAAIDGREA